MEVTLRGVDYQVLLVDIAEVVDRFYNVIANPILWFIQHYLWDLSNAPDIRRDETDAGAGYKGGQPRHRGGGPAPDRRPEPPLRCPHDYHLYTCPVRSAQRPDAFLQTSSNFGFNRQLADPARRSPGGDLSRAARERDHGLYRRTAALSPAVAS